MTKKKSESSTQSSLDRNNERRSKIAEQVTGSPTIMRSVLPDFARVALMIQNGVRGQITLKDEDDQDELGLVIAELTGFFAKVIDGKTDDFELYWDDFIDAQNPNKDVVIQYLKAAVDGHEERLIVETKKYPELQKAVAKVAKHNTVVLSRKGERLPVGEKVETIPADHFGVAIFWESARKSSKIKKIVDQFQKK